MGSIKKEDKAIGVVQQDDQVLDKTKNSDIDSPLKSKSETKKKKKQPAPTKPKKSKDDRKQQQQPENDVGQAASHEMQSQSPSSPTSSPHQASPKQGNISRINMDGTISYVEAGAPMVEEKTTSSPGRKSPMESKKKKKDVVVIQDENLAKKLAKFMAKKERKRKRRERFRQDPMAFLKRMNSSIDSLGDMSKSTIESLYGSVCGKGGLPPSPTKLSPTHSPQKNANGGSSSIHSAIFPGGDSSADHDRDFDDDDDRWEEDLESNSTSYVSQSNSAENDELLKAATSALEKYQRRWSLSDESTGLGDTDDDGDVESDAGMTDASDKQSIDDIASEEKTDFDGHGLVVDKLVVKGFVEDMGNGAKECVPLPANTDQAPVEDTPSTVTDHAPMKEKKTKSKSRKARDPQKTSIAKSAKRSGSKTGDQDKKRKSLDEELKAVHGTRGKDRFPPNHIDTGEGEEDCVSLDLTFDLEDQNDGEDISKDVHAASSISFGTGASKRDTTIGRPQSRRKLWKIGPLVMIVGGGIVVLVVMLL